MSIFKSIAGCFEETWSLEGRKKIVALNCIKGGSESSNTFLVVHVVKSRNNLVRKCITFLKDQGTEEFGRKNISILWLD